MALSHSHISAAVDESLDRDERERERRLSELELDDTGSLGLLQSIYRSPAMPLSLRMRAAIEALPFEHTKLSVTASLSGGDFADRLERAFNRSRKASERLRMIEDQRQHVPDRSFRRA